MPALSNTAVSRRCRALKAAIELHFNGDDGDEGDGAAPTFSSAEPPPPIAAEPVTAAVSTPFISSAASAALVLCLEEFLGVLAGELVTPSNGPPGGEGSGGGVAALSHARRRISTGDVGRALAGMGLADLAAEAVERCRGGVSGPPRRSEQSRKRRREFSREQAEEQERLLAVSKMKMACDHPPEPVQD